jgi:hypothetical protein
MASPSSSSTILPVSNGSDHSPNPAAIPDASTKIEESTVIIKSKENTTSLTDESDLIVAAVPTTTIPPPSNTKEDQLSLLVRQFNFSPVVSAKEAELFSKNLPITSALSKVRNVPLVRVVEAEKTVTGSCDVFPVTTRISSRSSRPVRNRGQSLDRKRKASREIDERADELTMEMEMEFKNGTQVSIEGALGKMNLMEDAEMIEEPAVAGSIAPGGGQGNGGVEEVKNS